MNARALFLRCFLLLAAAVPAAQAQPEPEGSWAWRPLVTSDGVVFSYLFYQEAQHEGSTGNGVVLMLANRNTYPVSYRFKMVFRSGGEERVEMVEGRLGAGEVKTGSAAGLFWIPFSADRSISEVGLRGLKIVQGSTSKVQS